MKPKLAVLSLLTFVSLCACGSTFATLDYSTTTPQVVEVDLEATGVSKFFLRVKNLGQQPLTLHRDQIVLRTVKGDRVPLPGGADVQVVEPGATLPIVVRYATQDVPDDTLVSLRFDKAFTEGEAPLPAPAPMKFRVGGLNGSS